MCVQIDSGFQVTQEDMIVYKVVRPTKEPEHFLSQYPPYLRYSSDVRQGTEQIYIVGSTHMSSMPQTHGFYTYREFEDADGDRNIGDATLECRIPAGTKIRWGHIPTNGERIVVVLTETLQVVRCVVAPGTKCTASID